MTLDVLKAQLSFAHGTLNANAEGVTQEESLIRPNEGTCFNWVLGHIVNSRHGILKVLDEDGIWSDEDKASYKRGGEVDTSKALPTERVLADYNRVQEMIMARLEKMTAEDLQAPCPHILSGEDSTVGVQLGLLIFHEAYHAGQLGVLRRVMNKSGAIA